MQKWSSQLIRDLCPQVQPQNLGYHLHISLYKNKILIKRVSFQ